MSERVVVCSRHMLRRRARRLERRLERARATSDAPRYKVVPAQRGPWRWYVVMVPVTKTVRGSGHASAKRT